MKRFYFARKHRRVLLAAAIISAVVVVVVETDADLSTMRVLSRMVGGSGLMPLKATMTD